MANFSENERLQASAKIWLAAAYVKDLEEFAKGDQNRFGRMVDSKGVAIASPAMWLKNLANIASNPAVKHFYATNMTDLVARVTRAGFELPEDNLWTVN